MMTKAEFHTLLPAPVFKCMVSNKKRWELSSEQAAISV